MATVRDILSALLIDLGCAGVEIAVHPTYPTRLRHRPATLAPELVDWLRLLKSDLLAVLRGEGLPDDMETRYVMGERLGVADELGMPMHIGSPAWLVATGESIGCSCDVATDMVHSGHGKAGATDSGGGQDERRDALRDRQGRECGPESTVAVAQR